MDRFLSQMPVAFLYCVAYALMAHNSVDNETRFSRSLDLPKQLGTFPIFQINLRIDQAGSTEVKHAAYYRALRAKYALFC